MSLRQKYLKILSEIMPAGAVGVSLLLGSAAPGDANQHPAGSRPAASELSSVSERLAAIREAVSDLAGPSSSRPTVSSSSPGEIGGATGDGEVPAGATADGATGATVGATGVGTIGGVTGNLSVERSRACAAP